MRFCASEWEGGGGKEDHRADLAKTFGRKEKRKAGKRTGGERCGRQGYLHYSGKGGGVEGMARVCWEFTHPCGCSFPQSIWGGTEQENIGAPPRSIINQ